MNNYKLRIDVDAELELHNIASGVFFPLVGFLSEKDYKGVVGDMHLVNGQAWTIPITLAVHENDAKAVSNEEEIDLVGHDGSALAVMFVESVFRVDFDYDVKKVFGTSHIEHPGVRKEVSRSPYRIGGAIKMLREDHSCALPHTLRPEESRRIFKSMGWKTIAGFQTRNPIHRAHEYLQRLAMEMVDGVFLQPLIGWKKEGDITIDAIVASYDHMIKKYYPPNKVILGTLTTPMRYAGPREAVFHAIIRRNFGCTHFIVGRDHAGVGSYYKKYEAQEFCRQFNDLGISILELCGPYYCKICENIVTEKTCSHGDEHALSVSGTEVRRLLSNGEYPPSEYMRRDISEILTKLNTGGRLFIKGE